MIEKSIFKDGANKNLTHPKTQRGITLIALIITIVILLVLAVVTITAVNDGGIIGRARETKATYEKETIIEQIKLDLIAKQAENSGNISQDEVKDIAKKYGTVSSSTLTTTNGYKIEMNEIWSNWENTDIYKLVDSPDVMDNPPEIEIIENKFTIDDTNLIRYKAYDNGINTAAFFFWGNVAQAGTAAPNSTMVQNMIPIYTDTNASTGLTTIEFKTDSQDVYIILGSASPAVIQIDSGNGYEYLKYDYISTSTYSNNIIHLKFSDSNNRNLKIETKVFGGVLINNNSYITPNHIKTNGRAVFIGSSITESKGFLSYSNMISYRLNLEGYNWGVGATGYLKTITVGNALRVNYYDRLLKNIEFIKNSDIIVIEGGINDADLEIQDVVEQQTKCINLIKQNAPNARIIIIGQFCPRETVSTNINTALRNNCLNKSAFIDLLSGDTIAEDGTILTQGSGPYITGTGRVGAEQNDGGNADLYIDEDGTHPTQAGCDYLGNRLAEEINKILNY